ncbi:MAG: YceI family protein [Mycobacteriales bacterium]
MSTATQQLPGYAVGTWTIDPVHSDISFTVRHMMVSKVRGRFATFEGKITTSPNPLESSAEITVDLSSIDTGNEQRDNHLRSADFFSAEDHPKMTFRTTGVRQDGDGYVVDGELTLKEVTRTVPLIVEVNGFGPDAYGGTRAGFTGKGELNRKDFGVNWNAAIEGGGVVIGDKITILLEVEAVLDAAAS